MKKLFFLGCAAMALTFASCSSNKAEQKAEEKAAEATEQVAEQAQEAATEVVNEVLKGLQSKVEALAAKVAASKKADVPALTDEIKALKEEMEAASLTEDEKAGLKEAFNKVVEALKAIN